MRRLPLFLLALVAGGVLALALAVRPPQRSVLIEVRKGERMRDLAARLERAGLIARGDADVFAATAFFPSSPLIPRPQPSCARFEGLLRPGIYRIPAGRLRFVSDPSRRHTMVNAQVIFMHLLTHGAVRLNYERTQGDRNKKYDGLFYEPVTSDE